jgi:hypothetical protein
MRIQSGFAVMVETKGHMNTVTKRIKGHLKEMAGLSKDLNMNILVAGYENMRLCNVETKLTREWSDPTCRNLP